MFQYSVNFTNQSIYNKLSLLTLGLVIFWTVIYLVLSFDVYPFGMGFDVYPFGMGDFLEYHFYEAMILVGFK